MIGMIQYFLNCSDILKLVISLSVLLYLIALIIIHGKMNQNEKSKKIWNILCFVPLLLSVIHCIAFASSDVFSMMIQVYKSIYIPSVFIAFLPLLAKKKPLKIIGNVLCVAISLMLLVLSLGLKDANYTRKSMRDAYLSACDYIEENYVLAEWKKVDWEKLKTDGLALIDEAEKTGDTAKYYDALYMLINSLHDAHAGVYINDTESESSYVMDKIAAFGDYGLSLITLDNGDTIAVNVEEGLEIKNGDIITKWDGIPVDEAIEQVVLPTMMGTTTLEHEKLDKTFFLAGVGEDTVNVTYINSDGKEIVATLSRIEGNQPRAYDSIELFTRSNLEKEYDYRMLDDNIGYMRVTEEKIDEFSDNISDVTGNHTVAREMFRKDLRELRDQGMTKLVIDIRYNAGGSNDVATALTSLFTKEKMFAYSLGVKNGEKMKAVSDRYVMADGEFSDLEIVVLTSMRCVSAGDGLALFLSRLPNVTVAGLTNPLGVNQKTGGRILMPESAIIEFPNGLSLDENGNPNIDIDDTRQSRNPVDIKIPLDKDTALKIFSGEEYELEWAVDYLNGNVS